MCALVKVLISSSDKTFKPDEYLKLCPHLHYGFMFTSCLYLIAVFSELGIGRLVASRWHSGCSGGDEEAQKGRHLRR